MRTVNIKGKSCHLRFGYYKNGTVCIDAIHKGERFLTLTRNLEDNYAGDDYCKKFTFPIVVLAGYSENEGVLRDLLDADVIQRASDLSMSPRVYFATLTRKWQYIATEQLAINQKKVSADKNPKESDGVIEFSREANFLGRNGYFRSIGLEITNITSEKVILIEPVTTRRLTGRCTIEIPQEDLPKLVSELKTLYNDNDLIRESASFYLVETLSDENIDSLRTALKSNPDDYIEEIEGILPSQSNEWVWSVKDFCSKIGIK